MTPSIIRPLIWRKNSGRATEERNLSRMDRHEIDYRVYRIDQINKITAPPKGIFELIFDQDTSFNSHIKNYKDCLSPA